MWVFVKQPIEGCCFTCRVLKLTELAAGKERWMGNGKTIANWTHENVSHSSPLSEAGAYNKALHSHLVQLLEVWQEQEESGGRGCYCNHGSPSRSATMYGSRKSSQTHILLSRINMGAAALPAFHSYENSVYSQF